MPSSLVMIFTFEALDVAPEDLVFACENPQGLMSGVVPSIWIQGSTEMLIPSSGFAYLCKNLPAEEACSFGHSGKSSWVVFQLKITERLWGLPQKDVGEEELKRKYWEHCSVFDRDMAHHERLLWKSKYPPIRWILHVARPQCFWMIDLVTLSLNKGKKIEQVLQAVGRAIEAIVHG